MTKSKKIHELEARLDNLVDDMLRAKTDRDMVNIMIEKEIIQAQLTALNWVHGKDERAEMLVDFLLYLNDKGLISNYDFVYRDEVCKYLVADSD